MRRALTSGLPLVTALGASARSSSGGGTRCGFSGSSKADQVRQVDSAACVTPVGAAGRRPAGAVNVPFAGALRSLGSAARAAPPTRRVPPGHALLEADFMMLSRPWTTESLCSCTPREVVVRRMSDAPSCVAMTVACITPLDSPGQRRVSADRRATRADGSPVLCRRGPRGPPAGCVRSTWRGPDDCDEQLGRHGCEPTRHGQHHLGGRRGDHLGRADWYVHTPAAVCTTSSPARSSSSRQNGARSGAVPKQHDVPHLSRHPGGGLVARSLAQRGSVGSSRRPASRRRRSRQAQRATAWRDSVAGGGAASVMTTTTTPSALPETALGLLVLMPVMIRRRRVPADHGR